MSAGAASWDRDLEEQASPSPLLQTWGWGEVQSHAGWTVERVWECEIRSDPAAVTQRMLSYPTRT